MFLKTLSLRQFRNYAKIDITLSPGLNLFVGPNGSGKSNLLEAIAVLCSGSSHRGAEQKHLIQWEKSETSVKGHFDGEHALTLEMRQKAKRPRQFLLNTHVQKRARDWVGKAPVVSFSPDDLALVKGEPSLRRRMLNAILCQSDPAYWEALQLYNKIMEERNSALRLIRDEGRDPSNLDPWDASLLKEGAHVTLARQRFVKDFAPLVNHHQHLLSSGKESLELHYKSSFHTPSERMADVVGANRDRLEALREGEVALGSTLIGPHRDDLELFVNGTAARAFASQGQQRTLALAFKLAEREFLAESLGRAPLCLLDDVLSELDPSRRANMVQALGDGSQTLVTLTHREEWAGALPEQNISVLYVSSGAISPS